MPVVFDADYLSLDFKEREVSIPVDSLDRAKGCVTVTIREIPFAVKRSLELRRSFSFSRLPKAQELLSKLDSEHIDTGALNTVGETLGLVRDTQCELVKWGVSNHRAEDFLLRGAPVQFESVPITFAGVSYQIASPRMVQLYASANGKNNPYLHTTLLANIANAVVAFQEGQIVEPEEVWSAYEKPTP